MSPLIPKPPAEPTTYTKKQVEDKLSYWAEHRKEWFAGTNTPLTLTEINGQLDRWLGELSDLIGPA